VSGSTLASAEVAVARTFADSAHRTAIGAALLACACVLGLLESALPAVLPVPWLRLGLANLAVVAALALVGPRTAAFVSAGRVLLVGLASGTLAGPVTVIASAGAIASVGVMCLLAAYGPRYSMVGWSAAGSAAHVVAQFAAAAVVLNSGALLVLAPASVLVALVLGAGVGLLARMIVSRLPSR